LHLKIALIDAADDVGARTSKANSAILHTGFDAPVGTLEAEMVRRGHHLLSEYATRVGIPLQSIGAMVLAWSAEDLVQLKEVERKARANGYGSGYMMNPEEVYWREPHVAKGVLGAYAVPDESIICPFTTPLALATDAVVNGASLYLQTLVTSIQRSEAGDWLVGSNGTSLRARWLVNAAGLHSDSVEALVRPTSHKVTPRRGEFVVFDKHAASMVSSILLGVPTPKTKGVLITPTVFGNVLLGPTAEDLEDKADTRTTHSGIDHLLKEGEHLVPGISEHEITSTYSGLRAVGPAGYEIDADPTSRYGWAYGIRSTGLTASMAIAERLLERMKGAGLSAEPKGLDEIEPVRGLNYLGEDHSRATRSERGIQTDPDAGKVMCFCEMTTLSELKITQGSPIPPTSMEGLWRRTRATGGRCQGFYCKANISHWFQDAGARD
jgi:glycerol-3-phosphate dehydrogenase